MSPEQYEARARAAGRHIMAWVLAFFGTMFVILNYTKVAEYRFLARKGIVTQGQVVYQVYEHPVGSKAQPYYSLVYRFDYHNTRYEGTTRLSQYQGEAYTKGTPIAVRFDPNYPYLNRAEWDTNDSALEMMRFGIGCLCCASLLWGVPWTVRRIQTARLLRE